MHRTTRIKMTELNPHLICVLCGGYFIDATTIVECLHSFCKTCIVRYLEMNKYCPVCETMVHKTKPLKNIKPDKALQDLVYKLVPGLYKNEMKKRRDYYSSLPVKSPEKHVGEDMGIESRDRYIYTEDENISLSMEFCPDGIPANGYNLKDIINSAPGQNAKITDVRYLQCPAAVSVSHLKKFIRMKFELTHKYEMDVFHTDEPLKDYYTLMDIAYIYTWRRNGPLRLFYSIYENETKRQKMDKQQEVLSPTKDTDYGEPKPKKAKLEHTNGDTREIHQKSSGNSVENNVKKQCDRTESKACAEKTSERIKDSEKTEQTKTKKDGDSVKLPQQSNESLKSQTFNIPKIPVKDSQKTKSNDKVVPVEKVKNVEKQKCSDKIEKTKVVASKNDDKQKNNSAKLVDKARALEISRAVEHLRIDENSKVPVKVPEKVPVKVPDKVQEKPITNGIVKCVEKPKVFDNSKHTDKPKNTQNKNTDKTKLIEKSKFMDSASTVEKAKALEKARAAALCYDFALNNDEALDLRTEKAASRSNGVTGRSMMEAVR